MNRLGNQVEIMVKFVERGDSLRIDHGKHDSGDEFEGQNTRLYMHISILDHRLEWLVHVSFRF